VPSGEAGTAAASLETAERRSPVLRAYHTGITVADLGRALGFYRDLLGLEVLAERVASEPYIQRLVDAPGGTLHLVHMRIPGTEHILELIEYRGVERRPAAGWPRDPGQGHICLFVEGLDDLCARLREAGISTIADPVTATAGRNAGTRIVYARDPDGFWVELMEEPTT
jgi:glyoxylase I family protein